MPVITISRGSFSHGTEIAEKVAQQLGYVCISRDVLIEASKEFNIPEIKLFHALHDAPSILDRIFSTKEKYIAYIQAAILKALKKDNVVYHGFAGHFFVKDISHVLKVRIIADIEERVSIVMKKNVVSREEALKYIHKIDEQRRKWSQQLYGIETSDPSLYDLVIHISLLTLDDAVEIICHNVGLKRFQKTPESQQKIEDLYLAAEIKALLIDLKPDIKVASHQGMVQIDANATQDQKLKIEQKIRKVVNTISGIKNIQIDTQPIASFMND